MRITLKHILIAVVICLGFLSLMGCGNKLRTPPWDEKEIMKMETEEQKTVPLLRYEL